MTYMRHRCGGELQPQLVKIKKKIGYYPQSFTVEGYKCDNCGDEVISRDIALEIDRAIDRANEQLRRLWRSWDFPSDTRRNWSIPSDTKVTGSFARGQVFEENTNVRVPLIVLNNII